VEVSHQLGKWSKTLQVGRVSVCFVCGKGGLREGVCVGACEGFSML
jgi:hypothetical protein